MSEALLLFLGTVIAAVIGLVGTWWNARNARHDIDSKRRKLESDITADVLSRAHDELEKRDKRIDALEADLDRMQMDLSAAEEAAKIKDKYILHLQGESEAKDKKLDEFKKDVRSYIGSLIQWFEQKGIHDYPKPPRNIMDTGELMKGKK